MGPVRIGKQRRKINDIIKRGDMKGEVERKGKDTMKCGAKGKVNEGRARITKWKEKIKGRSKIIKMGWVLELN